MGMPRHGHPAARMRLMEELPVAALLASQAPPLVMKSLEHLPHFHGGTLPRRHAPVNTPNGEWPVPGTALWLRQLVFMFSG